jgi:hypothetical protein
MFYLLCTVVCLYALAVLRMAPGHFAFANALAGRSPLSVHGMPLSLPPLHAGRFQRIPRRLVQSNASSWCTVRMRRYATAWHRLNEGYAYEFYDNRRVLEECGAQCARTVEKLQTLGAPGAALADVFRMETLASNGGVWADMDCVPLVPIGAWVQPHDDCVLHIEGSGTLVHWLIASTANHPLICAMRDRLCRNIDRLQAWPDGDVGDTIFKICGPSLFDAVARECLHVPHGTPWQNGTYAIEGTDRSITLRHAHVAPGFMPSSFGLGLGLLRLPAVVKYAGFEFDQRSAQAAHAAAQLSRITGSVTLPSQFSQS